MDATHNFVPRLRKSGKAKHMDDTTIRDILDTWFYNVTTDDGYVYSFRNIHGHTFTADIWDSSEGTTLAIHSVYQPEITFVLTPLELYAGEHRKKALAEALSWLFGGVGVSRRDMI